MSKLRNNYIAPVIDQVRLDNEISLQLVSEPPLGPFEASNQHSDDTDLLQWNL